MAKIIPFCGLRYNQKKIKHLDKVVAPPYDVISKRQQTELYKANRYNFVRIDFGKGEKCDNVSYNKYSRAKYFLEKWIKQRILVKDNEPSFYGYEEVFNLDGEKFSRLGFIGLLKLEASGQDVVFPHEKTFCGPKEDRLKLLKAVKTNLSPIFGLYRDDSSRIDNLLSSACFGSRPIINIKFEGISHKLWRISDPATIRRLSNRMADKRIFIADGHHRYEVSCLYKKLMLRSKEVNADYAMMYFCSLKSGALKILPIHRALKHVPLEKLNNILKLLKPYFDIQLSSSKTELFKRMKEAKPNKQVFGLYAGGRKFYLLTFRPGKVSCIPKAGIKCYSRLDVVLLHQLILGKILGIKEGKAPGSNIFYTHNPLEAIGLVGCGKCRLAFFMNPPRPSQVSEIAAALKVMPYKSTYFYPKPLSGLVINRLEKDAVI
jgi:uncharacterized protein (DUF1015 family)